MCSTINSNKTTEVAKAITVSDGLPDILALDLRVIFCGINPGLKSARMGPHFADHRNRFSKTIHLAGFTSEQIIPEDDRSVVAHRVGLTTAVKRPTLRAEELSPDEFLHAASGLSAKMAHYSSAYVAFLGNAAFIAIFNNRLVEWGKQRELLGGSKTWILPNPSGLNRFVGLGQLVHAYTEHRIALDELQ